ncbi:MULTISPECIES: nucleoside-triphosphate diphosphatase [unclassified Streptococcus]|uniref:nucleoside-triphosphate diphosphatase n=1 Tax=unclassified Streptococcus TaxID=2608887 RepID=UPI001072E6A8|nr:MULTISPECIES: nucleoside-triphosphate diphosphatase [unclassified Streptococcus]MBF0787489.1 nucleoside-triphosphate diphosphatase [Streptococcus sp. 19428wC2_LYSM12]MCQ9212049.1 nucleoside-triphosphate diphosphatase [Streptococcus sp. B01]MCQ9213378.1 nucleoside-triphosphate diphosphatase [Streptococcus sp. O1]TFV05572.1 nucleoside-triphosphate diphosphatase [Streptococcus sp. LYSM12]
MTEKIYEYKDANDWYIGKWDEWNDLTYFGDEENYKGIRTCFYQLIESLSLEGLQVHLVKASSTISFLNFLIQIINEELGRDLSLVQHRGAVLVLEEEKIVTISLPQAGVDVKTFFGKLDMLTAVGDSILIATRNEGKTAEFRQFFAKLGYKVENLNDYPELPDVAETGVTFEENARLKAETISNLTGKMVLADDSGLKVDILGGMPGVWSARFSGPDATDARNNAKLLHELAMVFEASDRSAQFHCTLVVAAPNVDSLVVEADWDGYIATVPQGESGFGYDPLFLVGETGRTAAQLTLEEKNSLSHRAQALKKLVEVFPVWQEQNSKPL